jgi:hypothetical protein
VPNPFCPRDGFDVQAQDYLHEPVTFITIEGVTHPTYVLIIRDNTSNSDLPERVTPIAGSGIVSP